MKVGGAIKFGIWVILYTKCWDWVQKYKGNANCVLFWCTEHNFVDVLLQRIKCLFLLRKVVYIIHHVNRMIPIVNRM